MNNIQLRKLTGLLFIIFPNLDQYPLHPVNHEL
jgi:hypothetical protein